VLVFDATALDALIDAYQPVWTFWTLADDGLESVVVPALAILEVGEARDVSASQWESILWPAALNVIPLSETCAKEICGWRGPHAARQALWEARTLDCEILTRDERLYPVDARVLAV
jgi:hypothetical protein